MRIKRNNSAPEVIKELLRRNGDRHATAKHFGMSLNSVHSAVKRARQCGVFVPDSPIVSKLDEGAYMPTEDELIAARDAIRDSWSPAERRRRSHNFDPADEPSTLEVPEVAGVIYSGSRSYLIS